MRPRYNVDLRNRVPEEPKSSGYLSGILITGLGVLGLLFNLVSTWASMSILGIAVEVKLDDVEELARFSSYPLIFTILCIIIISGGIILLLASFLRDIEVISKNKSKWIKYFTGRLLVMPSIILISLSIFFTGSMLRYSFYHVFFGVPFLMLFISTTICIASSSVHKKEARSLKYDAVKESIGRKKKVRPIKIPKRPEVI